MEKWIKASRQWVECNEREESFTEFFYDSSKLHKIFIRDEGGESFLYRSHSVKDDLDLGRILDDGVLVYSIKECLNGEYPGLFSDILEVYVFITENIELFNFTKVSGGIVVSFMNKNLFLYGVDN